MIVDEPCGIKFRIIPDKTSGEVLYIREVFIENVTGQRNDSEPVITFKNQ